MRAASPRSRGHRGWVRRELDLSRAGEMLRDLAKPCQADPLSAVAFYDRRGRPRRIKADYAEGWTLKVHFDLAGKVSSYELACSMRVVA